QACHVLQERPFGPKILPAESVALSPEQRTIATLDRGGSTSGTLQVVGRDLRTIANLDTTAPGLKAVVNVFMCHAVRRAEAAQPLDRFPAQGQEGAGDAPDLTALVCGPVIGRIMAESMSPTQ